MANMENKLKLIFGDWSLGVDGDDFHYIISYKTGGLESLYAKGKEWLYRTPRPTFWRGLTDNDRGNRFHERSGMWLAADVFIKTINVSMKVDGKEVTDFYAPGNNSYSQNEYADEVSVTFTYETITVPATEVLVTYTAHAGGALDIVSEYKGKKGLPEMPVFGLRMIMPTLAEGFEYEGLSGETYPDRMDGGVPGVYKVEGLPVTPYMLPQECGMHMNNKWLEIHRVRELDNRCKDWRDTALRVEGIAGELFHFSCIPYTAEELENATHQEELPPARRTVLCVYGAVRGVGGIDSWGADVEKDYHVSGEEDISFGFRIVP